MKFFFFTPPAFSESLYFLFSYRSLYFSFRYFLVISRRISNNLFFDQLPGFVCFLCSGFFRFEKWNETYVFGGLYLLYLESFKYEPFRLLCFVLSFFLMSLLYAISHMFLEKFLFILLLLVNCCIVYNYSNNFICQYSLYITGFLRPGFLLCKNTASTSLR